MSESYNGADVRCALGLDHDGVWLPFSRFSGYQPQYLAEDIYRDEYALRRAKPHGRRRRLTAVKTALT
jgi:hypothetical protein